LQYSKADEVHGDHWHKSHKYDETITNAAAGKLVADIQRFILRYYYLQKYGASAEASSFIQDIQLFLQMTINYSYDP
jgi:hypothetical protein